MAGPGWRVRRLAGFDGWRVRRRDPESAPDFKAEISGAFNATISVTRIKHWNAKVDNEGRAALAASALVNAAGTDGWEAVRPLIVSWFGRGRSARKIERRLTTTRKLMQMAAERGAAYQDAQTAREIAQLRAADARDWGKRIADVLTARPDAARELDLLVQALRAFLPLPGSAANGSGGLADR